MRTPRSHGWNPGASVFKGSQAKSRPRWRPRRRWEEAWRQVKGCSLSCREEAADALAAGLGSRAELVF